LFYVLLVTIQNTDNFEEKPVANDGKTFLTSPKKNNKKVFAE